MKTAAVIALAISLAVASYVKFETAHRSVEISVPLEVSGMFQIWRSAHSKDYTTPEELLHRLRTFYSNMLFVKEMNAKAKIHGGATFALNLFADLHSDEFMPGRPETPKTPEVPLFTTAPEGVSRVGQQQRRDSVNWEKQRDEDIQYFPEIGSQDPRCESFSFAFALQQMISA